ncbi:MAG: hypothetical protein NTZ09_06515 [Candidatus Hydrogenedentes bacterium]|nr:hypothetical protein [Candidatus Hydrogenedentota bacterium]
MNSQRRQIMIMAALGLLLVGVLFYQFVIKGAATPAPAKPAATPAGKAAGGPAAAAPPAPAAAPGAAAKPVDTAEINIDALLASIQEVDFDYEKDRVPRDVMAPLVGKVAVRTDKEGTGAPVAPATLGKVMSKMVSGIVWDESFPVAVVDNEVVEPGYEYADGTIVESIEEDHVVFRVGESLIQVELKER